MQMLIQVEGVGAGYKGFNVSYCKRALLLFRDAPDEGVIGLAMSGFFDVGGRGPNAIVSAVRTQWFNVNVSEHDWLFDTQDLVGKFATLTVSGSTVFGFDDPRVSVTFSLDDEYHQLGRRFAARNLPLRDPGFQLGSFEIRSKLKRSTPDYFTIVKNGENAEFRSAAQAPE